VNAVYNKPLRFNENGHALLWCYVRDTTGNTTGQYQINLYKDGVLQNLGFAVNDNYNNTFFLNATGQVAGQTRVPDPQSQYNFQTRAAFHNGQGLVFPGSVNYPYSYGTGINDAGDVVGVLSNYTTYTREAFLYRNGQTQYLGTLGGSNAEATDINNAGDIVGTINYPSSSGSALLTSDMGHQN
jgi:probable HAF family extracellular repeat protein